MYNDRFTMRSMDRKNQIIASAEHAFDHHGFAATGMDQVIQAAAVSSRTLYKHVGSKTALIVAVLNERARRFFSHSQVDNVDELFIALETWTSAEGARGCLFLRAQGETGGLVPEIAEAVTAYRRRLHALIERLVVSQTGCRCDDDLVEQVLVLFEGAIATSTYRGACTIGTARKMAATLLNREQSPTR